MEAFIASTIAVAIAEMGDKTQLLALVLSARYRQPRPIILGIFAATLLNHAVAGALGGIAASFMNPELIKYAVGISFLAVAAWSLIPDKLEQGDCPPCTNSRNVFMATLACFFVAEIGDKTQVATVLLAIKYEQIIGVVLGTTIGMMIANVPVVMLGNKAAKKLSLKYFRYGAATLFAIFGVVALIS